MVSRWHANVGPTLNAGLVALFFFQGSDSILLRNLKYLSNFSGGGGGGGGVRTLCPPSLNPRMLLAIIWAFIHLEVLHTFCRSHVSINLFCKYCLNTTYHSCSLDPFLDVKHFNLNVFHQEMQAKIRRILYECSCFIEFIK